MRVGKWKKESRFMITLRDPDDQIEFEDEIKSIKEEYSSWGEYAKVKPTSNLFVWNVILRAILKTIEPVTAPANPRNLYEKHSRI